MCICTLLSQTRSLKSCGLSILLLLSLDKGDEDIVMHHQLKPYVLVSYKRKKSFKS